MSWFYPGVSFHLDVLGLPPVASRRHPHQMPKPPHLTHPHPIMEGMPSNPSEKAHFGRLYPQSHSFGHYPEHMTTSSFPSLYTVLQTPVLDSVELGDNTTLQCSVLTDASPGEHSVYWLRNGSGESPPGIIYTHGDTNTQCSRSSEADSPTQSCVYKLPKTNLSLSDAGTYYCAVAVCGQILFGNGTKLDFVESVGLCVPIIIVLATSNIISLVVVLFICRKLYSRNHKDTAEGHLVQENQGEALNYAALTFTKKAPTSKGSRRQQKLKDTEVYSQIRLSQ
ncbi:T-cell surface glycoprotein CD8 beta chain-like [Hoplias malabaricus]|uniref:T-cell surface glycoprotein CD8 beta chain-like n=1 Tax=Hoplias malabaricus TaxID=27720 RepID=UPI0034622D45